MDANRWNAVLARVADRDAADIDDITGAFDPRRRPPGREIFPEIAGALMPETAMQTPGAVCVGVRVSAVHPDAPDRALRLVAFGAEKDVEIVVLTELGYSGFERFGFRTERIAGATEAARAACERQIRRFWNIDLVL
jgi:hypothetical protein